MSARELGRVQLYTAAILLGLAAALVALTTYSGHEIPIYPSYYPQEIRIETFDAQTAGRLLAQNKVHAYVGRSATFDSGRPKYVHYIESLGAYLVLSVNRSAPRFATDASACALMRSMAHALVTDERRFSFNPYPITPLDADYLYYADLAAAAKARVLAQSGSVSSNLRVRARGALSTQLVHAHWQENTSAWEATLEEIDTRDLLADSRINMNGWLGPPWLKSGWFHAYLLLADNLTDSGTRSIVEHSFERLSTGAYKTEAERANLQRQLVSALTRGCNRMIVGYTLKREDYNADYSAGIENIGYDSYAGLNSAIFLRTVKLKDFPWNGWLRIGVATPPQAAWNPIGGFNDDAGRLIWFAIGDPALFPAPYSAGWDINRMADVKGAPKAQR